MRKFLALLIAFGMVLGVGVFMAGCDDSSDSSSTLPSGTTTTTGAAALTAPTQTSPANGVDINHFPRSTTLVWSAVPGAAKYGYEVEYDLAGTWTALTTGTVTDPTHTFDFIGMQKGRWRVWAIDALNNDGPKSGWFEFRYTI